MSRSSLPEVFSKNDSRQTRSKPTGEQSCGSAISIKLPCNFIEIIAAHGNHMKMQKCVIFRKKKFENKYLKDKTYLKV